MRKVTEKIADAFYAKRKLRVSNTYTDGQAVWLYGNKIVERRRDGIWVSLAGWNTLTTRERLNGILHKGFGSRAGVGSVKGIPILHMPSNSDFIKDDEWINVEQFNRRM